MLSIVGGGGGWGNHPNVRNEFIQHVGIRDPNTFWGYFSA